MTRIEQNKAIADFYGYNVKEFYWKNKSLGLVFCDGDDTFDLEDVTFFTPDTDWSTLMPVVAKISNIGNIVEISYCLVTVCRICVIGQKHEKAKNIINDNNGGLSPIEAVYKSVCEYVNLINKK